jgi:predicted ATP-dependent endonuclease of OLD family
VIQQTLQSFSIQITNDIKDQYIASLDKKAKEINIQLASINSPFLKTISLKYEFDTPQAKNSIFEEFKDIFSRHLIGLGAKEPSLLELLFSIEPSLSIERQPLLDALSQNSSTSKAKQWLIDLFTDEDNFLIYQTIVLKHLFNAFQYKTIRVLYDDRRIEDSSFGQRCTATLVILLQLGNNPIVIDEPEAHLDSLLISNYLVELIKEKKKNRQIIFATHNANFVINGDADLIHILDMTDEKITSIRCTSIEDKMNRKSLIGLEGGKEAFLNREKKYFINEIQ